MPDIEIPAAEGGSARLKAYLAVPDGPGPWPGVVAIHEILGLNGMLRRQADRLAEAGYLTLGPDLFSDGGAARCVVSTMRALSAGHGKPLVDIGAARTHLRNDGRCTGKVGIIGFCMGGGFALVSAGSGFDAVSANYGQVPRDAKRVFAQACPIVGSYGAKDVSLRGAVAKLEGTLTELAIDHDLKEYPQAGHSFLNDEYFGPSVTHPIQRVLNVGPEPASAKDAWARIEAFFGRYLTTD